MIILDIKGIEAILSNGAWVCPDARLSAIMNDMSDDLLDPSLYYADYEFQLGLEMAHAMGGKVILHKRKEAKEPPEDGTVY